MATNPCISSITLPSGSVYDIKDAEARVGLSALSAIVEGGVHYIGKTTSNIADGSTTNPIDIIDSTTTPATSKSVTAVQGDMVSKEQTSGPDIELIWNGEQWCELGSTGSLKALAFKDSASGSYTPAGTIDTPTFTGAEMTASATYTPEGSVDLTT